MNYKQCKSVLIRVFFIMLDTLRYSRTENSHILRVRIDPEAKKDQTPAFAGAGPAPAQAGVRLVRPGVLEIEWPRRYEGEEIPIE